MTIFRKKVKKVQKKEWKIKSKCLDLILECAKSNYPNEFGGLLSIDMNTKDEITELVILPGTIMGESHALFKLHMKPVDFSIVGTVHSHPSPSARPSGADFRLFRKHGRVHIIAAMPFDRNSWKAYDSVGEEIEISII